MPVSGDNTVLFRTTLFALVRTSMNMTPKDKGCFRDNNLRRIIRKLWPNTTQRMLDVILPEQSSRLLRNYYKILPTMPLCLSHKTPNNFLGLQERYFLIFLLFFCLG